MNGPLIFCLFDTLSVMYDYFSQYMASFRPFKSLWIEMCFRFRM